MIAKSINFSIHMLQAVNRLERNFDIIPTVKDRTGIIIQARTGSKRLPNKMLKAFCESPTLLDFILNRFIHAGLNVPVFVATTVNKEDDKIVEIVENYNGIEVFRGSEENVLERFVHCGMQFKLKNIIRICADNPLIDIPSVKKLVSEVQKSDDDYVAYYVGKVPSIMTHFGFWGEGVKLETLNCVLNQTTQKQDLEHVTKYIYHHENQFKIKKIQLPKLFQENENIRLTIDTPDDFKLVEKICTEVIETEMTASEIVDRLSNYPELLSRMKSEIVNNKKR